MPVLTPPPLPKGILNSSQLGSTTRLRWRSVEIDIYDLRETKNLKLKKRGLGTNSLRKKPHQVLGCFHAGPLSWFFMRLLKRRHRGRVVRAPDLKSGRLGFKSRSDHKVYCHACQV